MLVNILICVVVSICIFVFIGIPYINGVSKHPAGNVNLDRKREYVIANLQKFKVNNEGSSLDNNEIYLVGHKKMGFKDI